MRIGAELWVVPGTYRLQITVFRTLHTYFSKNSRRKITSDIFRHNKKEFTAQSKKEGKYQESIQSSTTPDPRYQWESDKRHN